MNNGIRIVTESIPHVRSVTVGFWYRVGSRDETVENGGMSHFIEHLMFKGTKTRSAREIAEVIDASGGQINAYTSKEHTCYYARVPDSHVALAINTLSDMLRNSEFSSDEIQKEKGVVLEEIKMVEDSPEELVHDLFAEGALVDHPLGRPILGCAESVSNIEREHLVSFFNDKYDGENLVVAAAGNLDHDHIVDLVREQFADLHQGASNDGDLPKPVTATHRLYAKKTEQVHLCVGGRGLERNHEDRFALFILDVALGGGMSSRFFQDLREDRGLVYSTYTYHTSFKETGLFTIYAGTSPENAHQVVSLIRDGIGAVVDRGIDEQELYRAKEQLKGSLMLGLEHSANRMSRIARAELFDEKLLTPDELIDRIDSVSVNDIARVTADIFRDDLILAAVGPVDDRLIACIGG